MLKQAVISGGVSSELRSAAVKMLFVKEENTSEPEPRIIKHKDYGGWSLFFINNDYCTLGLQ